MTTQVLVVDDQVIVARSLQLALTEMGYHVPDIVTSGEQAVARAIETRPDVVLMDIKLGGEIDGIEAAGRIRSRLDVPVIYVTAYADEALVERARVTEPAGYLVKPFDMRDLRNTIEIAVYRQAMARQLRDSEQKYRLLVEQSLQGIILLEGVPPHILFANPRSAEITGYAIDELLALSPAQVVSLIHPDDQQVMLDHLQTRLAGGTEPTTGEFRATRKDGDQRWIQFFVSIGDRGGQPIAQVAMIDITERKRAEQALRRAHEELELRVEHRTRELATTNARLEREIGERQRAEEELNQMARQVAEVEMLRRLDRLRSELIANVSHELRTPLGLIEILCTSLLMEDVQLAPEVQREFLEGIREETKRLETIVSNLLDIGRIESGRLRLDCHPADIGQLLREVIAGLQVRSIQHRLVHCLADEPLIAVVDVRQIEQLFVNLIGNAVKYSPSATTVSIEGHRDEQHVIVSVQDEGIGIPPEEHDRIFERFYRVDNDVTRRVGGVGLGLTVCKGIVDTHGGRIWVDSEFGRGSTFYVALPIGASLEAQPGTAAFAHTQERPMAMRGDGR